ncbi:hypothetical protein QUF54_09555 [Candidatus Marithioploca araucensis]|uniref:Uncharacterized protein n=1 Tax=Candidatus Marithioploca araucensis TaxID=70273 RepID=A0ABT7VVJ3_9GAMM|nr:hypothetical protein [Candidatus Marithioploca araucensis]
MDSNPLDPVWKAYEVSIESFEIVQEVIKQQKARSFTDSNWLNQPNAKQDVVVTIKEVEALFVFSLWATFERFVISYLQDKGAVLQQHVVPSDLASPFYEQVKKEFEAKVF